MSSSSSSSGSGNSSDSRRLHCYGHFRRFCPRVNPKHGQCTSPGESSEEPADKAAIARGKAIPGMVREATASSCTLLSLRVVEGLVPCGNWPWQIETLKASGQQCLLPKGYAPHQAAQLHRWIVKHSFTKSILQSDAETSLTQLVNTVATDLNLPGYHHFTHVSHKGRWKCSTGMVEESF